MHAGGAAGAKGACGREGRLRARTHEPSLDEAAVVGPWEEVQKLDFKVIANDNYHRR